MDVHLRDLRYFVAVAEELHFTRAARRLFVSQPALSRQIAKLEAELRVELFERDRRSVSLTEPGAALLEHARLLLADWDAARTSVADAAAAAAAVLRVGMQTSLGRGLVRRLRERLLETHPHWRVELVTVGWDDPTCGLASGIVDVAITWLPLPDPQTYQWVVLAEEPRHVALRDDHHHATREALTLDELEREAFIALPGSAGPLRAHWLAEEERAAAPVIGGEATSADEVFELISAGHGVALLAAGNAELYCRDGVVTVPVTTSPPAGWPSPGARMAPATSSAPSPATSPRRDAPGVHLAKDRCQGSTTALIASPVITASMASWTWARGTRCVIRSSTRTSPRAIRSSARRF